MEQYSLSLTKELGRMTNLTIRALPGRSDGRPPSLFRLLLFSLSTAWYLGRRARQFDIVHIGDLALWALTPIAGIVNRHCRIVISVHGSDIALPRRPGLGPALYGLYLKLGATLCTNVGVIANSSATASLCRTAGFTVAATVPLAVTARQASPDIPMPQPYILFVGRLVRQKGCRWFIENVLPRLNDDLRLVVAGTTWDAEEAAALENPAVTFLGPVFGDELAKLRREAMVVVMPNISCEGRNFEGFGLTAVETAADQGVLLAARLDGIIDAVVDKTTGFLLPPEDPVAWVHKIREIRSWPLAKRKRFIFEASELVRSKFAWSRVARQTLDTYQTSTATSAAA